LPVRQITSSVDVGRRAYEVLAHLLDERQPPDEI